MNSGRPLLAFARKPALSEVEGWDSPDVRNQLEPDPL